MKLLFSFLSSVALLVMLSLVGPNRVSAHEVYVLSPEEINQSLTTVSPNPFLAIPEHEEQFLVWGAAIALGLLVTLAFSDARWSENEFSPFLVRLKRYAPIISRITFGLALFASGYFADFFGPELPASHLLGTGGAAALGALLMVCGALVCFGYLTRLIATIGLGVFIFTICAYHWYMLTYVNYLGEIILFIILGGGMWSVDARLAQTRHSHVPHLRAVIKILTVVQSHLEGVSFFILRLLFGASLFVASFYAKFWHSNLALATVTDYHLTHYFHFSPLFLVLGAFLVESLIGLCFILGFQIRLASVVFTIFLTMSIAFFGEAVWPHIILFGVTFALFAHGYDKYCVGKWLSDLIASHRKGRMVKVAEPVL